MTPLPTSRYPRVEAVFFGQTTITTYGAIVGHPNAQLLTDDAKGDIISVATHGSLSDHVGTAMIRLKDRPPLQAAYGDYYQNMADVKFGKQRTIYPLSRSLYRELIRQHDLVLVKFFGHALQSLAGKTPDVYAHEMDFVGVVDSVQRGQEVSQGMTSTVDIVCKMMSKFLVEDHVVYFPYQGIVQSVDEGSEVLDVAVAGENASQNVRRPLHLMNRILGMLMGYDPNIHFAGDDELCRRFGITDKKGFQSLIGTAQFGMDLKTLLQLIYTRLPATNVVVNYSQDGITTFPATLRPSGAATITAPAETDTAAPTAVMTGDATASLRSEFVSPSTGKPYVGPTTETGERADGGLFCLQVDNKVMDASYSFKDNNGNSIFGSSSAPTGQIPIQSYKRIYEALLTGTGSVMGFLEGLTTRPWVEMFCETYGRRNLLVFRSPPFDYEDMVVAFNNQLSFKRITPDLYISDTLSKSCSDIYTLFSMEVDKFWKDAQFMACKWVALLELMDKYGVRNFNPKCDLMPPDTLDALSEKFKLESATQPQGSAASDIIQRVVDHQYGQNTDTSDENEPTQEETVFVSKWFDVLARFRDRSIRWFAPNPLFLSGSITFRCPKIPIRVGSWITMEHSKEIFYVEDTQKTFIFGRSPQAEVQVTRGYNRVLYPLICRRDGFEASTGVQVPNDILPVNEVEFTFDEWRKAVYPAIVDAVKHGIYTPQMSGVQLKDKFAIAS
jgi:hypothetical protein